VTAPLGSDVGAVVVAAGRGERLGGDRPKALVVVAGRPLVAHAVGALRAAGISHLVVVHSPGDEAAFRAALGAAGATLTDGVSLTPGGADRSASVRAGLAALPDEVRVVAVHDAARAFTSPAVIRATVDAVTGDVLAAAPALPVADTLKRTDGDEVVGTVDRAGLVAVQTPQVFPRQVLEGVTAAGAAATDDLALVEAARAAGRLSGRIVLVPGSVRGAKITYPEDIVIAEALAATDPDAR
jgi:2-C-methyl-D-erythritol 4-phosphate cytidylyltransferase